MKSRILIILVFLGLVFSSYTIYYLSSWAKHPVNIEGEVLVELTKGESLRSLSEDLKNKGLIQNALFFHLWVKYHERSYEHFLAGLYRFVDKVSPQEIIRTMVEGKTYNPLALEFTIPEGATVAQVRAHLISLELGTEEDFKKLETDHAWFEKMGIPVLEGFLFPATYKFFHKKPTPEEAYEKPIREFFNRLPSHYEDKLKEFDLTLEQWVSFASLIEKETAQNDERSKIAEVIWRRLKAGSPLGIDSTLIYGIPNFNGNLTWADLQNEKNPYNSRIHKGLPPTPIASPSLASLEAVFNPTSEGYYYFVLIPGAEKKHHFSSNFKEHSLHVQDLVRSQRSAGFDSSK